MRYGVAAYVVAVAAGAAVVGYLVYAGRVDIGAVGVAAGAAVVGFPFAVAGAGFPDIDHHAAKPHRFFKKWVSVIASVSVGYVLFASGVAVEAGTVAVNEMVTASAVPEPVVGVGVAAVGGVVAGGVAYVGVGVLKPPHRGVTHTVSAGLVVTGVVGVSVGYVASVVAPVVLSFASVAGVSGTGVGIAAGGVAATGFFVGFLSHLQCDGLLVGFLPDAM